MDALSLPGTLDALDDIRAFVTSAADGLELDKRRVYRLVLAVDEIATNIIVHGYQESNTSGEIRVEADVENGSLAITLIDDAPAYDPLQHPDPDNLDAPLADRQIGGLGVFLAHQNVDEFRYAYVDDQNRNTFVVHLQNSEKSS
ncbi:MAG: ATP-binding protein [Caldilineaceae bacterium]|nr:ATP-binding protein [Caldilineaceae bacterium]